MYFSQEEKRKRTIFNVK